MANNPDMRTEKIMDILAKHSFAGVVSLSDALNVSEMTVRRDLSRLEKSGDIARVYGGAKLKTKSIYEETIEERLHKNIEEKKVIAAEAAKFIEDGDIIALDGSTTGLEVCKRIKGREQLTVVTNNISIAIELSRKTNITIILAGGIVRKSALSLIGTPVSEMLSSICVDKAFISAKALSFERGLTDVTIDEGEAKKAMIRSAKKTFVIIDHTKIDEVAFFHVCDYKKIDTIITDGLYPFTKLQEKCLQNFSRKRIEVIIARKQKKEH